MRYPSTSPRIPFESAALRLRIAALLAALFCFACVPSATAAIAILDHPLTNDWTTTTTLNQAITVSTGASVLVVQLTLRNSTDAAPPTSIQWNSAGGAAQSIPLIITLKSIRGAGGTLRQSAIYVLNNPTLGTGNAGTLTGAGGVTANVWASATFTAVNYFTLSGVNTGVAPMTAGIDGDGSNTANATATVSFSNVVSGSAALALVSNNADNVTTCVFTSAGTTQSDAKHSAVGNNTQSFSVILTNFPGGTNTVSETLSGTVTPPNVDKNVLAVVVFAPSPGSFWIGGTSSDWGLAANWSAGVPNAPAAVANFGSSGANASVNLVSSGETVGRMVFNGNVGTTIGGPGTLTLDNSGSTATITVGGSHTINAPIALNSNATISGSGSLAIGGNMSETAPGSQVILSAGTLSLSGTNTYTGATTINGGTLIEAGSTSSPIVVGAGGTLSPGTITSQGKLVLTNASAPLTANGNAAFNFHLNGAPGAGGAGNDYILASNGPVVLASTNVINLSGAPTPGGAYKLITGASVSGTPTLGVNTTGIVATLNSTATDVTVTFAASVLWTGGGGASNNWATAANWGGTVPAPGTSAGLTFGTIAGTNPYTANNNIATQPFVLNALTLASSTNGNVISGNALRFDGVTPSILQTGSGSFTISNSVVLNANTSILGSTPLAGGSGAVTLSGAISGSGGLISNDPGAPVVTLGSLAGNTYSGNTTISTGTLLVSNTSGSATSAGAVTMGAGTTLAGTGIISGSVTLNGNAALAPGALGAGNIGTLTTGSLTLNASANLNFDLGAPTTAGTTYDQVAVNGDLNLAGNLVINNVGGLALGTYTLFSFSGNLSGGAATIASIVAPGNFNYQVTATATQVNLVVSSAITILDAPLAAPWETLATLNQQITVSPGASVLVVEGGFRYDNGGTPPSTISWGAPTPQNLTLAVSKISARTPNRLSAIYYLYNPTPGTYFLTGTWATATYSAVDAFTLQGVDTSVPPITGSIDGNPDGVANATASVTVSIATKNSLAVVQETNNADTVTQTVLGGGTSQQLLWTAATGNNTLAFGGVIRGLAAGSDTITGTVSPNGNVDKNVLAIACFAPPSSPIWSGGGGPANTNWSNAANWNLLPVSSSTGIITFPGSAQIVANNDIVSPFNLFQLNVLNHSNVFAGTNTISGNPLQFTGTAPALNQTSSAALNVSAPVSVNANTVFNLTGSGAVTLSGALLGSNAIATAGGGKLIVANTSAAVSGYVGTVTVSATGILQYDTPAAQADSTQVNVPSGATLTGTGVIGGPVTVNGTLSPGDAAGQTATLTVAALTLGAASVLNFDLNDAPGMPNNDMIAATGFVTLNGGIVNFNLGAAFAAQTGFPKTYVLVAANFAPNGNAPVVGSITPGFRVTDLSINGTNLTVTIDSTGIGTWAATASPQNWSVAANWLKGVPPSSVTTNLLFPALSPNGPDPYVSNNNISSPSPFVLNLLLLSSGVSGNVISGNPLQFDGVSPAIQQAGAGSFAIQNNLTLNADTTILGPSPVSGGSGGITLSGQISGSGGLISSDPGAPAVTLASVTGNSYSGNTTITTGKLMVSNTSGSATGSGAVSLGAGTTLAGTGTISGSVALNGAATLAPGALGAGNIGILTTGSLTLNSNAVLNFDLGAPTTPGTTYDQVVVNGDLNLAGNLVINDVGGLAVGTYTLFTCTGNLAGSAGTITSLSAPSTFAYQLTATATQVNLGVSNPGASTWATPGAANWSLASSWDTRPASSIATTLTFPTLSLPYAATNELANPFILNGLTITNTDGSTVSGSALQFGGTAPFLNQNAASGTFAISNPIALNANTAFQNTGVGSVALSGAISGAGGIVVSGSLPPAPPAAGGTIVLKNPASSFTGATSIAGGTLSLQNATGVGGITSGVNGVLGAATSPISITGGELIVAPTVVPVAGPPISNLDRPIVFGNSGTLYLIANAALGQGIYFAAGWTINAVDATPAVLRYSTPGTIGGGGGFPVPVLTGAPANTLRIELNNGVAGTNGVGGTIELNPTGNIPCKVIFSGVAGGNPSQALNGRNAGILSLQTGPYVQGAGAPGFFFENAVQVSSIYGSRVVNSDLTVTNGTTSFQGRGTTGAVDIGSHDLILSPGKTLTISSGASVLIDADFRADVQNYGGVYQLLNTVIQDTGSLTYLRTDAAAPSGIARSYSMSVVAGNLTGLGPNAAINLNVDTQDGGFNPVNSITVNGTVATVTTVQNHSFQANDWIVVTHTETEAGAGGNPAPTVLPAGSFGSFQVASVIDSTHFTYTVASGTVSADFSANTVKPVVGTMGVGFTNSSLGVAPSNGVCELIVNGGLTIQTTGAPSGEGTGLQSSARRISNLLTAARLGSLTGTGGFLAPKPNDVALTIPNGWATSVPVKLRVSHNVPGTGTDIILGGAFNNTIVVGLNLNETAATLDGGNGINPATTFGGTVRGFGTLTGGLVVASGGSIWPGATTNTGTAMTFDEVMYVNGPGNIDLSNGGKLKIVITNGLANTPTPGTINKQMLNIGFQPVLTLGPNSILSLGVGAGDYSSLNAAGIPIIPGGTGSSTITSKFGTVLGLPSGWSVVYQYLGADLMGDPAPGNPADGIVIRPAGAAVTPATLEGFTAKAEGAGVLLEWNAISEYQNAGFNAYRRAMNATDWARVNSALIAGRVTNPAAKRYALYDWAAPGSYEYKLESVSIQGGKETHPDLAGPVFVDAAQVNGMNADGLGAANFAIEAAGEMARGLALSERFVEAGSPHGASSLAFNADGHLQMPAAVRAVGMNEAGPSNDSRLFTCAAPATSRAANSPAAINSVAGARWFSAAAPSVGSSFTAAKVVYRDRGVLLIPQNMLPAGFDSQHVSIQREGRSLSALAQTPSGLVIFGQGYSDDYTDNDAIFLRSTPAATPAGVASHAQGLFASALPVNTNTLATMETDFHDVYFDYSLRPYNYAPWFSSQYLTDGTDRSFSIAAPSASSGPASLTVNLWSLTQSGNASPDHALQVLVNGQPVGQAQWSGGGKMMQLTFQIPADALNAGSNQIDLVTPALPGADSQISFLHSLSLSYTRALDASQPLTIIQTNASPALYELSHLPSADAWVVDTRFPDRAALVPYETQAQADGTFVLRFSAAGGGTGQFLVAPAGQENLPLRVTKRAVKPAKTSAYWAVGPSQFGAGVQPLLALRSKEGLRGQFIDQEQLFDAYNFGRYGPAGIQNAVRAARPQYLLLLGRTTYDYHNYSGLNVDPLCPAFLVSTSFWAQATSDSQFGDLGRGSPEIAVGRLPVNDASELSGAVNHILSYTGLSSGVRAHAAADQSDPAAGDFPAQADSIAQAFPDFAWQRNYLGVTAQSVSEVTSALTTAANGGADVLLYVGHGNASHLGAANRQILGASDVQIWTGHAVFLQSTCTANWMANDTPGFKSLAMQALTQPRGGISASIASSTYMNSQCTVEFMSQLLANASAGHARWGGALMRAQQWAHGKGSGFYSDLQQTEQLFGDPAMPVFIAPAKPAGVGTGTF